MGDPSGENDRRTSYCPQCVTVRGEAKVLVVGPLTEATGSIVNFANSFGPDQIQVYAIDTGDSITFRFTAGYLPKIRTNRRDIVVELPKAAATLILLGSLLQAATGTAASALDLAIKYRDFKSSALQEEKLEREVYELRHKVYGAPDAQRQRLQRSIEEFRRLSVENPEINKVAVSIQPVQDRSRSAIAASRKSKSVTTGKIPTHPST
jgi:hypothetical protein